MEQNIQTIKINGVDYVRAESVAGLATPIRDGMKYVIVRSARAGVHAGYLESRNGLEAVVRSARRLWYWEGAASLSQLAVDGVKSPSKCKFPVEVDRIELTEAIEVLDCTEKARASIASVAIWQM